MVFCFIDYRHMSTLTTVEENAVIENNRSRGRKSNPLMEYRHAFPEFLPDPDPKYRNTLREKLERKDMLSRRNLIDIPEFYVGKCSLCKYKIDDSVTKDSGFHVTPW